MPGITLETAQSMLDTWIAAEDAVSAGQSYSINNRQLTRANLKEIGERIVYWENKVIQLSNRGRIRITGGTPC
jgi:Flp pilus assembly protein TadG